MVLVAGGVGATFTIPIYQSLMHTAARDGRVRFVWAVRGRGDAVWGLRALREESKGERVRGFELFVTGRGLGEVDKRVGAIGEGGAEGERERGEGIELLERRRGLSGEDGGEEEEDEEEEEEEEGEGGEEGRDGDEDEDGSGFETKRGRPDLRRIVDEVFADTGVARVAVLVCGPAGMGEAVRKEVGRWVGRGVYVWWHCEEFAW